MNKIIGPVQDLRQACRSIPQPLLAMDQRHMQTFRLNNMNSIIAAVNWVCVDLLEDHEVGNVVVLATNQSPQVVA